jgi:hypothetical protein
MTTRPKDVSFFFGFDDLTGRVNNNPTDRRVDGQVRVDRVLVLPYNRHIHTEKERAMDFENDYDLDEHSDWQEDYDSQPDEAQEWHDFDPDC